MSDSPGKLRYEIRKLQAQAKQERSTSWSYRNLMLRIARLERQLRKEEQNGVPPKPNPPG